MKRIERSAQTSAGKVSTPLIPRDLGDSDRSTVITRAIAQLETNFHFTYQHNLEHQITILRCIHTLRSMKFDVDFSAEFGAARWPVKSLRAYARLYHAPVSMCRYWLAKVRREMAGGVPVVQGVKTGKQKTARARASAQRV